MSENFRACVIALEFVSKIKNKKNRELILKEYSKLPEFQSAYQEMAANVIKGHVPMDEELKNKLVKFEDSFFDIYENKNIKRHIVQSGGYFWIWSLISAAIDLLK
jgi:hypothetical protein